MPDEQPQIRLRKGWCEISEDFPDVLELSNPFTVAALLVRSRYWGNAPAERRAMRRGESLEYRPAELAYVIKRFDVPTRTLCVVFGLRGNPKGLRNRRDLFVSAQIRVNNKEWKTKKAELDAIVSEAMTQSYKRLKELKQGGVPI